MPERFNLILFSYEIVSKERSEQSGPYGLTDCSSVDMLGVWYTFVNSGVVNFGAVNFGAGGEPRLTRSGTPDRQESELGRIFVSLAIAIASAWTPNERSGQSLYETTIELKPFLQ